MRFSDVLIRLIGASEPNCPHESDVLAYSQNRLSAIRRAQLEQHFAGCGDCLQVLSFVGRSAAEAPIPVSEEAVSLQTNKILAYIENNQAPRARGAERARSAGGFRFSYPKLATAAMAMSLIAITGIFVMIGGPSAADDGMDALRLALKDERYTQARISGGFTHSRYVGTVRGGIRNTDDLHFERAEGKVKSKALEPDETEARAVMARVHLARGNRDDAKRALEILDQLRTLGVETHESLNDRGVALHQLNRYQEAIEAFDAALAKSPTYDEALFNKALAEQYDRRYEDAKRDWQQFINQSSDENWKAEARTHLNTLSSSTDRR